MNEIETIERLIRLKIQARHLTGNGRYDREIEDLYIQRDMVMRRRILEAVDYILELRDETR